MRTLRRMLAVTCLAAASVAASSTPAAAAVTIGQTGEVGGICGGPQDWAQLTVSDGNSYVVPPIPPANTLSITSWSHFAYSTPGQTVKLKVYRPFAGLTYTVVGQDARALTPDVLNTFPTRIAVQPGDFIGITTPTGGTSGCGTGAFDQTDFLSNGTDAPTGGQVTFQESTGARLNISAVVEPTNTFSFGKTIRNQRKGTATLTVNAPNPGQLAVSGKGAKEASAAGGDAITAKSIPPTRTVTLTIKAKGKKLKKLNRTGKVKLTPTITYTPTGGSPSTQSTKLKLKKRT